MIKPISIFGIPDQISPEVKCLVDVFISPAGVGRRYLFGCNEHSACISNLIDIDGFVDDYSVQGAIWNGKPVVNSNAVPLQAIVVNCVMCNMPVTAAKRIQKLGCFGVLAYSDLCHALPNVVPLPNFVAETRFDIEQNHVKWEALSAALSDNQSRQVLDDLISFRLTGNYGFMTPYFFHPGDQYFEYFLGLGSKEIFIDAGGFDGDTTELFIKRYPDYEKVYFFEPSIINLTNARKRLIDCRNVEFVQLGLLNTAGKVCFNPDGGSASCISSSGVCQIEVTTLDLYVDKKVTFIKMDLEGVEVKALQGAKQHIIADHPKLAIAVYHHPSDFWQIFEYVKNLRQDYKVFLRHYTEGWSETVMYFVPL